MPDRTDLANHTGARHKGVPFYLVGKTHPMAEQFADFISRERSRLHAEREEIYTQQHELETKLTALNNEMRAIDAYESAKAGRPTTATRGRAKPVVQQVRRGSRRAGLLAVIGENPGGLARGEILEKMGLKGDKTGEMAVSNALTGLTKSGKVIRADGKYRLGA